MSNCREEIELKEIDFDLIHGVLVLSKRALTL